MDNLQMYVNVIMKVLGGFKSECDTYACCLTTCVFYNKSDASCILRACPCDYDLEAIEKAVTEILRKESDGELYGPQV